MQGRLQDYCRLGVVHFMLYKFAGSGEGDLLNSFFRLCADPDLGALEVTWIKDFGQRREVAALLAESGKTIGFGTHPVILGEQLDINHPDERNRSSAVERLKTLIPQAYELGAAGFVVLSGKDPGIGDRRAARQQLVNSLLEIDLELKSHGHMPLILEQFDRKAGARNCKNCLMGPTADCVELAQEIRGQCPDFGLLLDLSHLPLLDEDPAAAVKQAAGYLTHAHLGNCVITDESHVLFGDVHPALCDPAGVNGIDQTAAFLHALWQTGFLNANRRPVISFEIAPHDEWQPLALLEHAKQVAATAFSRI